MSDKHELIELIKKRMVTREQGIVLSGGEYTTIYLDIPGVLRETLSWELGAAVLLDHLEDHGILDQAAMIAGPLAGAVPLVMGVIGRGGSAVTDFTWTLVRERGKDHGLGRRFVGAEPGPNDKVILVDDVASSGRSLADAAFQIQQTGAQVIAVVPLVDRGDQAAKHFDQEVFEGVSYLPVLTYADLDLPPLGAC